MNRNEMYKLLIKLGVRTDLEGFDYLVEGLLLCYINEYYVYNTIELYNFLAKRFSKTRYSIERNIRYCIQKSKIENEEIFNKNNKMTNSLFISGIVKYLHYRNEV